jgi:hypothetical protein
MSKPGEPARARKGWGDAEPNQCKRASGSKAIRKIQALCFQQVGIYRKFVFKWERARFRTGKKRPI